LPVPPMPASRTSPPTAPASSSAPTTPCPHEHPGRERRLRRHDRCLRWDVEYHHPGPSDLLTKITAPADFAGTIGFDTAPGSENGASMFHGPIDLSLFTNPGFYGLGSTTTAVLAHDVLITPPPIPITASRRRRPTRRGDRPGRHGRRPERRVAPVLPTHRRAAGQPIPSPVTSTSPTPTSSSTPTTRSPAGSDPPRPLRLPRRH